jgi:hypothetical protein
MSHGNPFDFGDADEPPRRRHRDADEFGDDPRPRRQSDRPGYGMGVASLVCGVVGLLVAVGSIGPALCSMCGVLVLPVNWVISGVGAVLGALGVLFGVVGRSQENRSPMPGWGIATGAVALVAAAMAIILPLVVVANMPPPPPQPAPPIVQPVPPKVNPPKR